MISREEYLQGKDLPANLEANLIESLRRWNLFRALYGLPMIVDSGFRTMEDHLRIYRQKLGTHFDISKVPMNSAHLSAQACDFADADGSLKNWIASNPGVLESCDLYMEDPASTPSWVHLQSRATSKRVFIP